MKRFSLLFTPVIKQDISALIAKIKKNHDCTSCDKGACTINKEAIQNGTFLLLHAEEFSHLKKIINSLYADEDINFILLIDCQEDKVYIYKGDGTLQELKEKKLPVAVKIYEYRSNQELAFFSLEDLRITMPLEDAPAN